MGTVSVEMLVIAVVEAEDVSVSLRLGWLASGEVLFRVIGDGLQAGGEPIDRLHAPVAGEQGPNHGLHLVLRDNFTQPGTAKTEGRTEQPWFFEYSVRDGFGAAEQFGASFFGSAEKKIGMRFGVIADEVAARRCFFDQAGTLAHEFSYQEKGGLGVVPVQQVEKFWSDGWVRAIVKGKSKLARGICLKNGWTKQLRPWMPRAMGGEAGETRSNNRGGEEQWIHRLYFAMPSMILLMGGDSKL
jgi:hypothetical protein